jgi:hypothetical protein
MTECITCLGKPIRGGVLTTHWHSSQKCQLTWLCGFVSSWHFFYFVLSQEKSDNQYLSVSKGQINCKQFTPGRWHHHRRVGGCMVHTCIRHGAWCIFHGARLDPVAYYGACLLTNKYKEDGQLYWPWWNPMLEIFSAMLKYFSKQIGSDERRIWVVWWSWGLYSAQLIRRRRHHHKSHWLFKWSLSISLCFQTHSLSWSP